MRIIFAFATIVLLFTQCAVNMHTSNAVVPENAKEAILDLSADVDQRTDPVTIKHVEQVGEFIMIDVSYSGGCEAHEFDLISDGNFSATYPTELEMILVHNANGDRCRSVVDQRLYFDLTPFQYSGTSQVRLILNNTNKTLDYFY